MRKTQDNVIPGYDQYRNSFKWCDLYNKQMYVAASPLKCGEGKCHDFL
jgi:hypothetical protein